MDGVVAASAPADGTRGWDPGADHDSYLDLTDPIRVAPAAFDDRAGMCEPRLWREVEILHDLRPNAGRRCGRATRGGGGPSGSVALGVATIEA